ncbi:MAG: SdiA-regulated domain-containing protein [Kiloniellales bacterium]|nr:SdiA-regulated domain-containing protein [Kiloniellales bacterium]
MRWIASLSVFLILGAVFGTPVAAQDCARDPELETAGRQSFSLTFLARNKIDGVTQPSGLALAGDCGGLWTISDKKNEIFKLDLEGEVIDDESFEGPVEELEGIALDHSGGFLLVVDEDSNEIVKFALADQAVADRRRLDQMAGFDQVAAAFAQGDPNKGLEGIAWNGDTGTVFVLKEGEPGLLLEISADLRTIRSHRTLDGQNGFRDPGLDDDEIDFSGIFYDQSRRAFWIVSDKAQRLFLYDWAGNAVVQSATLGYGREGKYREIEKAEGVAVDPKSKRLYVVSDDEERLYVFDIRP